MLDLNKEYSTLCAEYTSLVDEFQAWDINWSETDLFCARNNPWTKGGRREFRKFQGVLNRLAHLEQKMFRLDGEKTIKRIENCLDSRHLLPNIWQGVVSQEYADRKRHEGTAKLKVHRQCGTCWCASCQDLWRGQVGEENYIPPQ